MITLYGVAISNYYNKVKFALMEKDIAFIEEFTPPSQSEDLLQRSPLGKVPFIKTSDGYLSESQAILEYLEDAFPEHPLYPADAYERGKCREFIQHLELNVELIARRLYGEFLFGNTVSAETKDEVRAKLDTGLKGLAKLLKLSPYALGDRFSTADIVAWPHLQLVGFATQKIYGENLVNTHIPGIEAYIQLIESRPHAQIVGADRAKALEAFFRNK
ncbi:glutathione S-transferase family protein [Methylomonas sp. EFPC1]|uniref:Glutathione S-transferase family protein n=1 Tax=Methylomonas defluvii TaxID=3045149 RepID=A0ABU4UGU3_9GAMM|nr:MULTISPECIES: glutathione S-transferase family protein [unclassified Methylomonas]MDX8128646.1 glutathione S-transferase family protein [Methylomonas sp. OY6]QBC29664.1 glutathione S-transferase family protein [Methylomonas sp. LW13]QSB01459.1 glutathione S-transferase family protein [Methylomonas sp. EFPC1]